MTTVIIILAVALLFLLMSFCLFRGKGSWLIAGYNTAPRAEKQKYDKAKLCRAAGVICLVSAVMLFLMAGMGYMVESGVLPESSMLLFGLIFTAVILATVIAEVSYMNKHCRK